MLYSFVIPTRERHDVLGASIRSVLAQTRDNFELVVVDNASSPETRAVVESFPDPRIRYVRAPERLAMSDNWELGLANVRGDYVHFMGDDDGPLPDAIEVAEKVHETWPDKILTWAVSVYFWPDFYIPEYRNLAHIHFGRRIELRDARQFLSDLYAYRNSVTYEDLPSLYNSFVPRPLVEKIKAKYHRYFLSESPDIASALANAWHVDDYIFSYRPLAVRGGSRHSTGTSATYPEWNPGPSERFKAENGTTASKQLDARLSGAFLVEVVVADEMLRFRDTYFPEDAIRPNMEGLLRWFASAAPRFGARHGEVVAALRDMARKNNIAIDRIEIRPAQDSDSSSSFAYRVGSHETIYIRTTLGPHVRDIADMAVDYMRSVVPIQELEIPTPRPAETAEPRRRTRFWDRLRAR